MGKTALALLVASSALAMVIVGCGGSPTVTCQTTTCSSGTLTYQICSQTDGSVSYDFGGMSCGCSGSNQAQCQTCSTEVASYCNGGTGGGGSGGGGGGGNGVTCTSTFSGGVTGTYSPCAVAITYSAANASWSVSTAGNAIPATGDTWTGFSMTVPGMAATGTVNQTMSTGSSDQITIPGGSNPPLWEAGYGQGQTFGTASVNVTALGPSMDLGNGNLLYQAPHGTFTATLVDQNPMTAMPNVMQVVTF
jgi:hypothetical protein